MSTMPKATKKRSAEGDGTIDEASKKFKQTVDSAVVEEFTCPITNELPLDPVMGEDGRTYEKSAIEEYFNRQGEICRSPVTNEPIGTKLIRNLQLRNMLKKFVEDGFIDGEKADQWKRRIKDEKFVADTREKAENGDAGAMDELATIYQFGYHGVQKNIVKAFEWYEKGAEAGSFSAMASLGVMHIYGKGTEKNVAEGIALVGIAAQGGSNYAALFMGKFYAEGLHGIVKNVKRARHWLEKVEEGSDELNEESWNELKDLLEGLGF